MKYSICVIENKIPVIDQRVTSVIDSSQRLSISNIKYLLNEVPKNEWEEEVVYTLLEDLITRAEFFTSAFLNPSFFLNYNAEQEPYRPEIIILDWDIEGIDSEEYLLKLLEFSFSLICIYTGVDKKDEIEKIISQQRFNKYSERLPKLIFKGDENSVETLINLIQDKNNENFSFRFGKELRNRSVDASEKMLIELGKTTQNHISNYFAYSEDNKFDLIDFFAARYKNYLADIDFKVLEESKTVQATGVENQIAQAFWSHRIYFYGNNSRFVKKGDIVKKKDQDEYFLVINADCDLNKFWHKNQGSLAIIPLQVISSSNKHLTTRLLCTRKKFTKENVKVVSLSGKIDPFNEDHFILPFIEINNNADEKGAETYINLWGIPKDISHKYLKPQDGIDQDTLKDQPLTYEHLRDYERIASLSEQFLTPLIQKILNSISGFGTPDYHSIIQKMIKENIQEMFS